MVLSTTGLLPILFGSDVQESVDSGSNLDVAFAGKAALLIVSICVTISRLIKGKNCFHQKLCSKKHLGNFNGGF